MHPFAKAMVFKDVAKPFELQEFDLPQLNEYEVLLRTNYATICSSDLHTFYGRRAGQRPCILGHEVVGTVIALGSDSIKDYYGVPINLGEQLSWSVYAHEPNCMMSRIGLPQKSKSLYKYGHEELKEDCILNGGFGTHFLLKKGTVLFKLPSTLTPQEAAPLNCTHATIAAALRMAGDVKSKNVLISGVGMLGLSASSMAKEQGASHISALDINLHKLERACEFGTDTIFHAEIETSTIKEKAASFGGIDIIIETSGVPSALEKGFELLNTGGIMVLVGSVYPQRNISINAEKIVRRILSIRGIHNYAPQDLATAIRFLEQAKHKYPFHSLVEVEYPLNDLDAAFEAGNQNGYYRVGVTM